MKRKMYTLNYSDSTLDAIDAHDERFTAEEQALATEKELAGSALTSKEAALKRFFSSQLESLGALQVVVDEVERSGFRNVMSFGAGTVCREYLLKLALPEQIEVMACDHDRVYIDRAMLFFPEIKSMQFDFVADDPRILREQAGGDIELAVFFASAYVLDDEEFVRLFSSLRSIGIKRIIDFHSGYMSMKVFMYYLLSPLLRNSLVRRILGRSPLPARRGKFHGYSRSRGELRRLYRESGWRIAREQSAADFAYVATLEPANG